MLFMTAAGVIVGWGEGHAHKVCGHPADPRVEKHQEEGGDDQELRSHEKGRAVVHARR